jgi:hypothetical protein
MKIAFEGSTLTINQLAVKLRWPILDARAVEGKVIVLLDPDAYITAPEEKLRIRSGGQSIRNLLALSSTGELLWEAELPDRVDYYYMISSLDPIVANSFSSYRCVINPASGQIARKEFYK